MDEARCISPNRQAYITGLGHIQYVLNVFFVRNIGYQYLRQVISETENNSNFFLMMIN